MSNNALTAISEIAAFGSNNLKEYATNYLTGVNAVDEQLEFYIKNALAGSFKIQPGKRQGHYAKIFSYIGNKNNPPYMIIKNGDAFEINKIKSPFASLAVNSLPPKDMLRATDKSISDACRKCESIQWKEKDLFYVIGNAKGGSINSLFFIQGTCYASNPKVYDAVRKELKRINDKNTFNFNPRSGKIKNPLTYFKNYCEYVPNKFNIYAVIENKKYLSFPRKDRRALESSNNIEVKDITIPLPSDQNQMLNAKLISCAI